SRTLLALILLAGSAGQDLARGSTCGDACTSQRSACLLASKATAVACRFKCKNKADPVTARDCRRNCLSNYHLGRNACSTELRVNCLELCDASSICIDACGEQLRRCATALGKRGRPCRRLCKHDPVVLDCRVACLDAWVGGCRGGVQQCAAEC